MECCSPFCEPTSSLCRYAKAGVAISIHQVINKTLPKLDELHKTGGVALAARGSVRRDDISVGWYLSRHYMLLVLICMGNISCHADKPHYDTHGRSTMRIKPAVQFSNIVVQQSSGQFFRYKTLQIPCI
eukprot:scaffold28564_cov22-Prasinocladus_malaysianus.AAC.1